MANSAYQTTSAVMDFVSAMEPGSILDLGAGFGRWGFLFRCHLGPGVSLTRRPDQGLTVDAVEAYAPNVNEVYTAVYNRTHIGDAVAVLPGLGLYDIILCGDMIEHLEKPAAYRLLDEMVGHARQAVVIVLPFRSPLRPGIDGNEYEAHKSVWRESDFRGREAWVRTCPYVRGGEMGVVIIPCSAHARWYVATRRNPLRRVLSAMRRSLGVGTRPAPVPAAGRGEVSNG